MKKDNKQKVAAGIMPLPPQEQRLPPHQRPAQSNQKLKHNEIIQKNNDQERRHPRNDPIPMSHAHLLPILIYVVEMVPKQIKPVKLRSIRLLNHLHL